MNIGDAEADVLLKALEVCIVFCVHSRNVCIVIYVWFGYLESAHLCCVVM